MDLTKSWFMLSLMLCLNLAAWNNGERMSGEGNIKGSEGGGDIKEGERATASTVKWVLNSAARTV